MKSTKLQLRKIRLIEYLLNIQDEEVLDKLESAIQKSEKTVKSESLVHSKEQQASRLQFSQKEIKKGGLVLTQDELEKYFRTN